MATTDCATGSNDRKPADASETDENAHLVHKAEGTTDRKQLIAAIIALIFALIGGAAIGPCFKYMEQAGITPFLSASWRCQCMLVFLVPLAIIEYRSGKNTAIDWFHVKPGLYFPLVVHVLIASCLWTGNLLTWNEALKYTSAFKVSLIVYSYPVMLVIIMWFLGTPASWLEVIGVLVTFGGMVLTCINSADEATKLVESHWHELLGYILCFFAALFEMLPIFNRQTIKYIPLMQYTVVTTIFVTTASSLFALWFEGTPENGVGVFCQADNCIFGWTSSHWALQMLVFGFTVGVICIAGFNYAILHVPPLIFSASGLVDPFLTALISYSLGVDALPTLLTWLGGVIVMAGLAVISMGDHYREKEKGDAGGTRSRASSNTSVLCAGVAGYTFVNSTEEEGVNDEESREVKYGSIEMGVMRD